MRHRPWVSTVGYYIGMVALGYSVWQGPTAWWWAILLLYVVGTLTVTAGYHRLFCHAAYKTSKFWHVFFAFSGVMYLYASPTQWILTHLPHHEHSDTALDPHPDPRTAFLHKGYRNVPLDVMKARLLFRQNHWHRWLDENYLSIWLVSVTLIMVVSFDFFVKAYLPALGIAHFVGALHNVASHWGGRPRDLWWMEYLLPASGEWLHKTHHDHPRLWNLVSKWYHLDFGSLMIRAIRKPD